MDGSSDAAAPRVAAPRHLRRRPLHSDIPDTLLVPDVGPHAPPVPAAREPAAKRAAGAAPPDEATYRRKRLVALLVVLGIVISVPALIVALVLAG